MTDRPPDGLLPLRARGKHEIEAAGGWVVACGAYNEYGCMPTEVRDYIIEVVNRAASPSVTEPETARPAPAVVDVLLAIRPYFERIANTMDRSEPRAGSWFADMLRETWRDACDVATRLAPEEPE